VNVYPFIEAEKRCRRNVTRACEMLKVSRAAFYAYLSGPSGRDQDDADLASPPAIRTRAWSSLRPRLPAPPNTKAPPERKTSDT
jgi:hypothetical protein